MKLNDIAKLAGVSRSTVSRVVNDDPRVSAAVRRRVQETIAKVGYEPHAAARALASRRTGIIGLVIPEEFAAVYADPWFPPMIESCLDAAKATGLSVMLLMESVEDQKGVHTLLRRFVHPRMVDGLILLNSLAEDLLTPKLQELGFPYVIVGHPCEDGRNFIDISNREAAKAITSHLLGHGWERPAMLNGPEVVMSARDRRDGFLDAIREAGIDPELVTIVPVEFSRPGAYESSLGLLSREDRPDCIFAASDFIALSVMAAADRLGLRVPDDLGIAGFDDIVPERNQRRGLSTVRQPVQEMGAGAVALLNELINHRAEPPVQVWLETTLSIRRTCGCDPAIGPSAGGDWRKEGAVAPA